jgi:hypothetical protein
MQEQRTERGPRGKYARLICHGCRSRKIKCILPDPDDVGPLGAPLPAEKACERCRSMHLECILDQTVLGRPASKRTRGKDADNGRRVTPGEPDLRSDGSVATPSSLDIEGHIFAQAADDDSVFTNDGGSDPPKQPSKDEIFQSMIDPAAFVSSILASDPEFGSTIVHATTRWTIPLPTLVSHNMAVAFDER